MKASKFIVFLGGILGIVAFFLPLITISTHGDKVTPSAMQIFKGVDAIHHEMDNNKELHAAMTSEGVSAAKDGASAVKGIVLNKPNRRRPMIMMKPTTVAVPNAWIVSASGQPHDSRTQSA